MVRVRLPQYHRRTSVPGRLRLPPYQNEGCVSTREEEEMTKNFSGEGAPMIRIRGRLVHFGGQLAQISECSVSLFEKNGVRLARSLSGEYNRRGKIVTNHA